MDRTARISSIKNGTKEEEFMKFLESKNLLLDPYQPISLTSTPDRHQVATVTFLDNATLKQALSLPPANRVLNRRKINIDDDFDGFTILSEGTEVE